MSTAYIASAVRLFVTERAKHRCEYCQTQELIIGMPLEVEHIVPEVAGGHSNEDNLCLACPRCNRYKHVLIEAVDEATKALVSLFNPRQHRWQDHFTWQQDGLYIVGLTPIGRATVTALQMNNAFVVRARRIWIQTGWHPPLD